MVCDERTSGRELLGASGDFARAMAGCIPSTETARDAIVLSERFYYKPGLGVAETARRMGASH